MSDGQRQSDMGRWHVVLTAVAVLVSIGGLGYQQRSGEQSRQQLAEARSQADSAATQAAAAIDQAKAALLQNRMSDVDRFRENLKAMSQALDPPADTFMDDGNKVETYTVWQPESVTKELDRTDTTVRFQEFIEFRPAHKTRVVRKALNYAVIRMSDLSSMVTAVSSYEAAVALEPKVAKEISAMEYVMLASYAHALDGVAAAEHYVNGALAKFEGESVSFQKVLLFTTLAQLYYMHSPTLSADKGSRFFENAKDLLVALPAGEKSGVVEVSVWSEWAVAEYSVGREESGVRLQAEAAKRINALPVSKGERRRVLIDFWTDVEMARHEGGLKGVGSYSLGVRVMPIVEYEQQWSTRLFDQADDVPTPAPLYDDAVLDDQPLPSIDALDQTK